MKSLKVVYKAVGELAEIIEVNDKLEEFQGLVDGYIEAVGLPDDIIMICNENGKLNMLDNNFKMYAEGQFSDVIVGNVFFVGAEGEIFASLSDDQISSLGSMFIDKETLYIHA